MIPFSYAEIPSELRMRSEWATASHQKANGLRYHSPTGIPSHTAHRMEGRGKKGEQGSRRRLAHSPASDVEHTSDVETRESPGSGTLGVAVLGQGRLTQPQPARSQPPCLVPSCLIPTINKHIVLVHVNRLHARVENSVYGEPYYISGLILSRPPASRD